MPLKFWTTSCKPTGMSWPDWMSDAHPSVMMVFASDRSAAEQGEVVQRPGEKRAGVG